MKRKRSFITIAMAAIVLVSLCAVCVSTSVSAADSGISRASVKASPDLVGNPIPANTGPSACIPKHYHYFYLFVQGYDGALWYNDRISGIHDLTVLGVVRMDVPRRTADVVTRSRIAVGWYDRRLCPRHRRRPLARTTANDGASWSGWYQIGGQLARAPDLRRVGRP